MPPIAKYCFQYLFVQAEFGLMCPVSITDTSNFIILRYGSTSWRASSFRPACQDPAELCQGAMFMTEKGAGSDVGDRCAPHGRRTAVAPIRREMVLLERRRRPGDHLARPAGRARRHKRPRAVALPRLPEDGSATAIGSSA